MARKKRRVVHVGDAETERLNDPTTTADGTPLHPLSQPFHDVTQRHQWRRFYHDFYQRFGDELSFSPGYFVDLWAFLTLEIRVVWLAAIYFVFELLYTLLFVRPPAPLLSPAPGLRGARQVGQGRPGSALPVASPAGGP